MRDGLHHLVDKIRMAELPDADVDGDAQMAALRPMCPLRELGTGRLKHPASDRNDERRFFRGRDEIVGPDPAALRMIPTQQRFDACHAAIHADLRLVVDQELVFSPGLAQIRRESCIGGDQRLHLRVEKAHCVAARVLGLVHREIGLLEQFADAARRLAEQRDADAAGTVVQVTWKHVRLAQRGQDPVADDACRGRRLQWLETGIFDQDHELVAAQPRHRVALGDARTQPLGHLLQQHVALLVPERVVEDLEVVQVNEHQGALARPLLVGQGKVQPVQQELAIRQLGERVVEGQVLDLLLCAFAFADVASDSHPVRELA